MFKGLTVLLMIVLEPIGYVRNACQESQAPEAIKKEISEIEILPGYAEGLRGIEQCEFLDMVFAFHQEKRTELQTRLRTGETTGVFASRSPRRPNHLGVTTVKLLGREGNILRVGGADALDGSPVVDIKYCDTSVLEWWSVHDSIRMSSPRVDIVGNIMAGDTRVLLLKAAQLHGHVCPGLALGVMGAVKVMQKIIASGEDIRDYTLFSGMQNCPIDGALFVTGCTPGTNRFVMGSPGNDCFYVMNKAGKGWKVALKDTNREYIQRHLSDGLSHVARGLAVLDMDFDELLILEPVEEKQ